MKKLELNSDQKANVAYLNETTSRTINLTVDQLIIKPPCPQRGKYLGRATSSRMWFPQQPLENKLHYTRDIVLSVAGVRDIDVRKCIS